MGLFKLGRKKEMASAGNAQGQSGWENMSGRGGRNAAFESGRNNSAEAGWDNMAQSVEEQRRQQLLMKHQKRILAQMSGRGFENWEQVNGEDLDRITARYHDREAFFDGAADFMDAIKRGNSEQKYQQYLEAIDAFADKVYGAEDLERTQRLDQTQQLDRTQRLADTQEIPQQRQAKVEQFRQKTEYERNLEKLRDVEISGDGYKWQGQEYYLTKETLAQCDLAPDSMIEVGGREIQMSKAFKVGTRDAVIGYVRADDGKLKARSYYRSNSQGVWRYLPDYAEKRDGSGGMGWYGKGFSESALTLPAELQMALNYQAAARPQAETGQTSTEFLLAGTAARYESKDEYARMKHFGQLRGDLYREVNYNPRYQFGTLTMDKDAPESLQIGERAMPNFIGGGLGSYRMNSALAGPTQAQVFDSMNRDLKWTMCTDQYGRSWVGNVETNAPVTSTGCRSEWVEPGDMATPLYEYRSMSSGYGDERDSKGSYVNMWTKYLSKMPVIQRYMMAQNTKRKVGA